LKNSPGAEQAPPRAQIEGASGIAGDRDRPAHIAKGARGPRSPVRESHLPDTRSRPTRPFRRASRSRTAAAHAQDERLGLPESRRRINRTARVDASRRCCRNSRLWRGVDHRIARTRINPSVLSKSRSTRSPRACLDSRRYLQRGSRTPVSSQTAIRNLINKPYATYSCLGEVPYSRRLVVPGRHRDGWIRNTSAGFATDFGGAYSHTGSCARPRPAAVLAVPGLLEHAAAADRS